MLRCEKEALSEGEMVLLSLNSQIFVVAIERLYAGIKTTGYAVMSYFG